MPRISVFSPSHHPTFLDTCAKSLSRQTFRDWEWIVVLNRGAEWSPPFEEGIPRIRLAQASDDVAGVGSAKGYACSLAEGEILVELDHDDELASTALARIWKAFQDHPEVGFVYSDSAQINADGTANEDRFGPDFGWEYKKVTVDNRKVLRVKAMEPTPHNVSLIWYAPNHVRAFRRSTYDAAGGYDITRDILDDQDLMARLYQVAPFLHLPSTLYLQRIHDLQPGSGNTQSGKETNARIQNETLQLYDRYIQDNALAWARRQGLHAVDLGSAHNKPVGYIGVDQYEADGVDEVCDVEKDGLPFEDSSVGVLRAADFLEHIDRARVPAFMNEAYRVLAPGGLFLTLTPSTDGRGAFQDPTHVSWWNSNSFWYYTQADLAKYLPEFTGRFQISRIFNTMPSQHDIVYVCANLIAVKDGPRQGGILKI